MSLAHRYSVAPSEKIQLIILLMYTEAHFKEMCMLNIFLKDSVIKCDEGSDTTTFVISV